MGSSSYQKILEIFKHLAVVALTPIESDKVLDSLNFLDFLVEEKQEADELIMRVITSDSTTDTLRSRKCGVSTLSIYMYETTAWRNT